jgi:hypothetical protein
MDDQVSNPGGGAVWFIYFVCIFRLLHFCFHSQLKMDMGWGEILYEADHSLPSESGIKNAWSGTFTPPVLLYFYLSL